MLLRRMLLFASLLLVMGAIASAISPRKDDRATAPPASTAGPASAAPPARRVEATLPDDKTVRVRVGDQVTLHVRSRAPDEAEIQGLGLSEPAEPDLPALLDFVAPEAGRYPVTLSLAGRNVGVVEVSAAR